MQDMIYICWIQNHYKKNNTWSAKLKAFKKRQAYEEAKAEVWHKAPCSARPLLPDQTEKMVDLAAVAPRMQYTPMRSDPTVDRPILRTSHEISEAMEQQLSLHKKWTRSPPSRKGLLPPRSAPPKMTGMDLRSGGTARGSVGRPSSASSDVMNQAVMSARPASAVPRLGPVRLHFHADTGEAARPQSARPDLDSPRWVKPGSAQVRTHAVPTTTRYSGHL